MTGARRRLAARQRRPRRSASASRPAHRRRTTARPPKAIATKTAIGAIRMRATTSIGMTIWPSTRFSSTIPAKGAKAMIGSSKEAIPTPCVTSASRRDPDERHVVQERCGHAPERRIRHAEKLECHRDADPEPQVDGRDRQKVAGDIRAHVAHGPAHRSPRRGLRDQRHAPAVQHHAVAEQKEGQHGPEPRPRWRSLGRRSPGRSANAVRPPGAFQPSHRGDKGDRAEKGQYRGHRDQARTSAARIKTRREPS